MSSLLSTCILTPRRGGMPNIPVGLSGGVVGLIQPNTDEGTWPPDKPSGMLTKGSLCCSVLFSVSMVVADHPDVT